MIKIEAVPNGTTILAIAIEKQNLKPALIGLAVGLLVFYALSK